jgi:pimeloyl-ACP methyl ester carboxylesterase
MSRALELGNALQITIDESGDADAAGGAGVLLLHGGAGARSMAGLAAANAFRNGQFHPVLDAGHFPHIEQPKAVLAAIGDFADNVVKAAAG